MMRSLLLKDLLPFAAITIVIFYSSSVFFFNLLFSTVTATASERESEGYATSVFLQVFTLPFTLFLDNPPDYTESGGGTDQEIGSVGNKTGVSAFKNFFVFVFLIVVNIVMVNLLIALFSLRVSTMVSRARCIWRRKYFHLMQEFQHASPVPPPFSFIYYILAFSREVNTRKCKERQKAKSQEKEWWKSDGSSYPEDYLKFLRIQASCFSRNRANFLQQLEENQPDFDALKAFTRNSLAQMRDKLGETMDKQEEKLEGMNDSLRSAMLDRMNSLESKVDQLVQLISKS
uniref:Ion_trans domain-containing protein n=1 Tax=Macrostomum lignano TaxID=282301 RepID=A0A1I8GDL5_9PLAT